MVPKVVRIDGKLTMKFFSEEIDNQIVDELLGVLPEIQELRRIHPRVSAVVDLNKKEILQPDSEFEVFLKEISQLILFNDEFLIAGPNKLGILGDYLVFIKVRSDSSYINSYVAYVIGREDSIKIHSAPLNGTVLLEYKAQENLKYMVDSVKTIHKIVSENKDWLEPLLTLESF